MLTPLTRLALLPLVVGGVFPSLASAQYLNGSFGGGGVINGSFGGGGAISYQPDPVLIRPAPILIQQGAPSFQRLPEWQQPSWPGWQPGWQQPVWPGWQQQPAWPNYGFPVALVRVRGRGPLVSVQVGGGFSGGFSGGCSNGSCGGGWLR